MRVGAANFKGVVVGVADPFEIDGPFFLRFDDGYTAPGEYKELNRCIAQASESDTDSLKALLRNAEENAEVAAYFIWKEEGCPDGRDLVHWDMAIENLKRARAGVPVSS